MDNVVSALIKRTKPGEIVLLEYLPSYIPEFVLVKMGEYARENGVPFVIDDNFDTLPIVASHLDALGIKFDFSGVYVIKTAGRIDVGNVIARVPFHPDPRVYARNYENTVKELFEKFPESINLVLGIENVIKPLTSPSDLYFFFLVVQRFLGNTRRKAFYLVNEKILESLSQSATIEMRRIASSVVKMIPYPTGAKLRFVKSPDISLLGREFIVDVGDGV